MHNFFVKKAMFEGGKGDTEDFSKRQETFLAEEKQMASLVFFKVQC